MSKFTGVAALTIVSKNYISLARVLCKSFLENHPGSEFYVLLVDIMDGEFDPGDEQFKTLFPGNIGLPNVDIFPYQYNILELNTAVKPFALKHLLSNRNIHKLAYIDPDILIARELDKVWKALDTHSVVLTPHMRQPYNDNYSPTEIGILQSGTYNLGFIGLKNNDTARKLLDWWIGKLYLDCVVDIPNGLFVDQKWMDLAPAYFADTNILHDPSYNAAYWNLHERDITEQDGNFYVDGLPLSFFHFSGFNPCKPDILSKHQNRHSLASNGALKRLFDKYTQELLNADYVTTHKYVYAYGVLANGIPVARSFHKIIRHCLKYHIKFPSPADDPDSFCEFMMSPTAQLFGYPVPPVIHGILLIREDVLKHFTDAWYGYNEGFMGWLGNTGKEEENLATLIDEFGHRLRSNNPVQKLFQIYESRGDLKRAFPNLAGDNASFTGFCNWIKIHGVKEENLTTSHADRLERARNGFHKALILYFMRPDLQVSFPKIHRNAAGYCHWILQNLKDMPFITEDEAYLFNGVSPYAIDIIEQAQLRHNRVLRHKAGAILTNLNIDQFLKVAGTFFNITDRSVLSRLTLDEAGVTYASPIQQLEAWYYSSPNLMEKFPKAFKSSGSLKKLYENLNGFAGLKSLIWNRKWMKRLNSQIISYQPNETGINISGYFDAPTGMGQSSRSILKTVQAAGLSYAIKTLPNIILDPDIDTIGSSISSYFGRGSVENRVNLIVSNADAISDSIEFFPLSDMHDRKNIGYWVWETEELPASSAKAAAGLDEIWTPSEYSAAAIRRCVDIPVNALPHVLDFEEIDEVINAGSNRARFNLPEHGILIGYFFDQKSVMERKNPQGVIDAFRIAQGHHPSADLHLVLKVSDPRPGDLEYELLKSANGDLDIIWVEQTFSRRNTLSLMNCLDAYISLHRSEGFGLTMAEAMALGKPVIASNYSGNIDFMDHTSAILVETPTIKTTRPHGPYPRGSIWGNPNVQQAANGIAQILDVTTARRIGENASAHVRNLLAPEKVGKRLVQLLDNGHTIHEEVMM